MSKIYEALEHARRELKGAGPVQGTPSAHPSVISAFPMDLTIGVEKEMTALYRTIETLLPDRECRFIQFIGAAKGEGSSTIALELAKTAALKLGKMVLLLDADQQGAGKNAGFNIIAESCLEEAVEAGDSLDKALCRMRDSNLFLSAASHQGSLFQFADSPLVERIWELMRERFDLVLIDSPPAAESSDDPALARKMDGVILVLAADRTRWPVVESVKNRIRMHGGNVLGLAFNKRQYFIPEPIYKRL